MYLTGFDVDGKIRGMNSPFAPNKFYSLDDISKVLDVSRTTVRSQFEDKNPYGLPFMKVGNQYRVLGENINRSFGSESYTPQPEEKPKQEAGAVRIT